MQNQPSELWEITKHPTILIDIQVFPENTDCLKHTQLPQIFSDTCYISTDQENIGFATGYKVIFSRFANGYKVIYSRINNSMCCWRVIFRNRVFCQKIDLMATCDENALNASNCITPTNVVTNTRTIGLQIARNYWLADKDASSTTSYNAI